MLSHDRAVKRHGLASASTPLPFVSMSAEVPGTTSSLGDRLRFAIAHERHRGSTAVENALMLRRPELFRSRGTKNPDPIAMKAIADFLHVSFEWLVIGSGPMRAGGRGETPLEEAIFVARDWGIREDAFDLARELHAARASEMTAEEWFDAIRAAATRLERDGVPRPAAIVATKDAQARVRRAKKKLAEGSKDDDSIKPGSVRRVVGVDE